MNRNRNKTVLILAAFGVGGVAICVLIATVVGVAYYLRDSDESVVSGNNVTVMYDKSVTRQDAEKLAAWFVGPDNRDPMTIKLSKNGSTYEVRVKLKRGLENDAEYIKAMKSSAGIASKELFGGAPCDFIGCDDKWNDLRTYPGSR